MARTRLGALHSGDTARTSTGRGDGDALCEPDADRDAEPDAKPDTEPSRNAITRPDTFANGQSKCSANTDSDPGAVSQLTGVGSR